MYFGILLAEALAIPVLWLFYLAVMSLSGVKQRSPLSRPVKILGYPLFALGYFLDFCINIFTVSFIFLDPPRQWTVSQRLQQYVDGAAGWRQRLAIWFATSLLNPFSPGGPHVKRIPDLPTTESEKMSDPTTDLPLKPPTEDTGNGNPPSKPPSVSRLEGIGGA